ncbi:helix-turn-helix domain-containing protein [Gordonia sp. CPCC 206044]|uniref:helix-turn-helix transcriptional regulator n=1 Tax=Gordonia sp. CPCC 206044 TaxID=3140793 RepID=UPI003AF3C91C
MASDQRDRIRELLVAAPEPLSADEIARQVGVHVTTARFHLTKMVDEGTVRTVTLRSEGVGRPRVGYLPVATAPVGELLGYLLEQLGSTTQAREHAAAEAGRLWADRHAHVPVAADLPDPVTVASETLSELGFRVSGVMSALGTHELRICSCPLRDLAATHTEVARGVARGVIEQALAAGSPALASQYTVNVLPDPSGGDCEITLRLSPLRRNAGVISTPAAR